MRHNYHDSIKFPPPVILTVAGSDCSGGAGIQADIKAISALGAYAASVITAVTAQNTKGVQGIHVVSIEMIRSQLTSVFEDLEPSVVKTGMVFSPEVVDVIVEALRRYKPACVVCDPVMVATSGDRLITEETIQCIQDTLFPLCSLITPNLKEASLLAGRELLGVEEVEQAALDLNHRFGLAVLIKSVRLSDTELCDVFCSGDETVRLIGPRIATHNLHGSGCTLSSAIAALLGQGCGMLEAVEKAKRYVSESISLGKDMHIGHGNGPLWHF